MTQAPFLIAPFPTCECARSKADDGKILLCILVGQQEVADLVRTDMRPA